MPIEFHKMHGAGNDFVVLDLRNQPHASLTPGLITKLCDRHRGIGCDQLVVLNAARGSEADLAVAFFNPDGSEAGACGNASRCVALFESKRMGTDRVALQTMAGLLPASINEDGRVTVDMGAPRLDWTDVPLAHPCDTLALDLPHRPAACSMGNPHATLVFGPEGDMPDPAALGPVLEHHALFPERANIGFARMIAPDCMRLRVWERGAGLTLACGSGACAAVVNAARQGHAARACTVEVDGGVLDIDWRMPDRPGEEGHVFMTGPATFVFSGVFSDSLPEDHS
ncbi:diaminopimelate epimerase [Tanticharoenia sakaeratensis]|uniref:Diaminopimelate epimerase n=1 Tax=Tanticharoenia sakaeratensis NBRC 103193 TaxID=1231623 RepID=A0A0D6MGE0_9PROT|nr:diaminopimelate epimerase [Tanticharoenia sakaeratensis]GAN52709.1 diaminopimelate epimerase [Tanticharoenia sakaeratensis NBRC 103193]GBQ24326.1 diaminopimelate epimerase [Tanticharoenia sakaeratensis NBRC 103193]